MINTLYPGKFRNMNKPFYPFFKFNKSTKVGELSYFTLYYIVYLVFFFKIDPWVRGEVFKGKVDFLLFRVEMNNFESNVLTFFYIILRSGYMAPTHIVNMQKSVKTTKVDKSTEGCKTLYTAFNCVTNLGMLEKLLFAAVYLLFKETTPGKYNF